MNNTTTVSYASPQEISREWMRLKEVQRGIRSRDAAQSLGVSEAHLMHVAAIDPDSHPEITVTPLEGEPSDLFAQVTGFGHVMALTRNSSVVAEKYGSYGEIGFHGKRAIVHTTDMDLRIDFHHWHHVFAVTMPRGRKPLHGLLFFDIDGTAVHKVYLTDTSDMDAYHTFVSSHAARDVPPHFETEPADLSPELRGSESVDAQLLRSRWHALTDTHQFAAMLNRLKVRRLPALRLAGKDLAEQVAPDAWRTVLENARDAGLPIMVFVRSPGCTQIYSGCPANLRRQREFFNVLDSSFHLHILERNLVEAWIVRKPTDRGTVTSLEVYDDTEELAIQFFGIRDSERRESSEWRSIIEALPGLSI